MKHSIERERQRLVKRAACFRTASQLVAGAAGSLHGVASVVSHLGDCLYGVRSSLFYLESDAARQYESLTGIDLGGMLGNPELYADRPLAEIEAGDVE